MRYAPQTGGLQMNCTIEENCFFFGRISGLHGNKIETIYNDLIHKKCHLLKSDVLLKNLDEGHLKQIIFTITLMGNPDIVFLDECTSFVDLDVK